MVSAMRIAALQTAVHQCLCEETPKNVLLVQAASRNIDIELVKTIARKEKEAFEFNKLLSRCKNMSLETRIALIQKLKIPSYGGYHSTSPSCVLASASYSELLSTMDSEALFILNFTGNSEYHIAVRTHIMATRQKLKKALKQALKVKKALDEECVVD